MSFTFSGVNANKLMGTTTQMRYSVDGGSIWVPCSASATDLTAALNGITEDRDIGIKDVGNNYNVAPSPAQQTIDITKAAAPTAVTKSDCTTASNNDGKLTGLQMSMEYKGLADTVWTDVAGTEVTNLPSGIYNVRFKAAGTVLASDSQDLVIGAFSAPPSSFVFSDTVYSALESAGSKTITVYRIGSSSGDVTVDYSSAGGTATAGSDYTDVGGTLTFVDGVTSRSFTITLTDDSILESDETVLLTLSNPQSGTLLGTPHTATLTLTDDDGPSLPPPSSDAGLSTIWGQSVAPGPEAGTSFAPKTAAVRVANAVSSVSAADIVKRDAAAVMTFFGTDSTFTVTEAGSVNLASGTGSDLYIKVTAADSSVLHYKVTVTRAAASSGGGGSGNTNAVVPAPAITISEVKSPLFGHSEDILVEADVNGAFGQSVTVTLNNASESQKKIFALAGPDDRIYPFDISLYSKNSNEKVQPKDGYSVRITLPIPSDLLEDREKIKVVYGKDNTLETLHSVLSQKDGKWFITFEAVHFSPYALIVSQEPATAWTNPFADVNADSWYYPAVAFAVQNSLMNGTDSRSFSPDGITSRSMIVTILHRLSGSEETAPGSFTDVSPDAYYANAVAWAQQKGIVTGYGNGKFGPDDTITREQLAVILWKYAGSPAPASNGDLTAAPDAEDISSYAKDALAWAKDSGIVNGKSGGKLAPTGKATRAKVSQMMLNLSEAVGTH